MHQTALQENAPIYLGIVLLLVIVICGITLMNNKNK